MQMYGAPQDMNHASKRQRLSLLDHDDLFNPPRTSLLFPALNPVTNHDDATVLSQHSLMAAYTDTMEVRCWAKTTCALSMMFASACATILWPYCLLHVLRMSPPCTTSLGDNLIYV